MLKKVLVSVAKQWPVLSELTWIDSEKENHQLYHCMEKLLFYCVIAIFVNKLCILY